MAATSSTFRPGTVRWLSSEGHPGYGRAFAAQVWANVARFYGEAAYLAAAPAERSSMVWAGVRAAR